MATTDLNDVDPVFIEVCKMVYGPDADARELWDISKMDDPSEVHATANNKKVSVAYLKHTQSHQHDRVPGCVHCKTSVKKDASGTKPDDRGKKALVGGLLFGSGAEGMAVHRSFTNLSGGEHAAQHAKRTKLSPIKDLGGTKAGKAAEVGIQAVNLGVGLAAAKELVKKPKKAPVAKSAAGHGEHLVRVAETKKAFHAARDAHYQAVRDAHAAGVPVQDISRSGGGTRQTVYDMIKKQPIAKRGPFRHMAPEVIHAANGRARRNGLRLVGATATTAAGGAGFAAGRHTRASAPPANPALVAKADRREDVHRVGVTSNAIAGTAGAAFGAAKVRDSFKEQYPAKAAAGLKHIRGGAHRPPGSMSVKVARVAEHAKPGFKTLAVGSSLGALGAGAHRLGSHMDRVKAKQQHQAIAKSALEWVGVISKFDEEKRQVFGWANLSVVDGKPVVDLQGDHVEIEEIEKSAYTYVLESRKGGDMHARVSKFAGAPKHTADMIESVVITDEKIAAWGLEPGSLPLGWWVGYHVNDDQQWDDVKSGKRLGFSIHGTGTRRELVSA